ncbi:MAG: ATP-dependent helicase, partial [Thaumarchaeota archaeon]|nr:ATP-dependent helicase [Nitrososphaerota archaeon]
MMDTSMFNANQLKAVSWGDGPLLVHAGSGSGKTKVLSHRIARLIEESPGEYFRVLCLTFTNKATTELQEHIDALVPNIDERINITTFHSFSTANLRQHSSHLGLSSDFTILSQEDCRLVLDEAIAKAGMTHVGEYDRRKLLSIVTKLTEQNIPVDTAPESLRMIYPDNAQQIGKIYQYYRKVLIKNNELDFGRLVAEAIGLLTKAPIANLVRRIYPYICVDEFQNINSAQYQLLCSVVDPDTRNLFAVADVDPRIYGWNGASQDRVRQLKEHFDMNILNLPENYRCPSSVVNMANKLIANNPRHDVVGSIPSKSEEFDKSIRVMEFDMIEDEAAWVAKDIAMRPAEFRQNCVILARTRSALKYVIDALEKNDLYGHLSGSKNKFVNDRMAWLYTVMRLANTSQDDMLLRQICKLFHILEGVDLIPDKIISDATINDGNYLHAWYRAAIQKELNPITTSFLKSAMPKLIDRLDVKNFVDECFEWFEQRQNEEPAPDYDTEYMNEKNIWNGIISDVNTGHEDMTLSVLLQQIELYTKESPAPKDS